jgi:hypothetical protein
MASIQPMTARERQVLVEFGPKQGAEIIRLKRLSMPGGPLHPDMLCPLAESLRPAAPAPEPLRQSLPPPTTSLAHSSSPSNMSTSPPALAPPHATTVTIDWADTRAAGGTKSEVFNRALIRDAILACAKPGEPGFDDKAAEVAAAMAKFKPRNALEAYRASLIVAAYNASLTAYACARACQGVGAPSCTVVNFHLLRRAAKSSPLGATVRPWSATS